MPLSLVALSGCGGGGDDGDNMNDYWVSATRFANGTKKIRLVNGPGYVTITPTDTINIGPDADDPKSEEKHPSWASASTVAIEMVGAEGSTRTFTGDLAYYETDPDTQTAVLTINSITQPLNESDSVNFACANLVEILGGVGRIEVGGGFNYFRIRGPVIITLDFNTGTWDIQGECECPTQPTLVVHNPTLVVIRAY